MRNLLRNLTPAARRALTVPNVLATVAMLLAVSGTAYAATQALVVTGAHVRDGSLTTVDVKNYALESSEFSATAQLQLRKRGEPGTNGTNGTAGTNGATGEVGDQGPDGDPGPKGSTGAKGSPAPKAYTHNKVVQSSRIKGHHPNPLTYEATYVPRCASDNTIVGCDVAFPRWNYTCNPTVHCGINNLSTGTRQTPSYQSLLLVSSGSGGLLDMPFNGTVVLNASATFYTQRTTSFQRIECQLQLDRVTDSAPAFNVGEPVSVARWISRDGDTTQPNETERLLNVAVSGAVASTGGLFGAQLACRAPDDNENPTDQLEFIEGNIRLLSTRTNGQA